MESTFWIAIKGNAEFVYNGNVKKTVNKHGYTMMKKPSSYDRKLLTVKIKKLDKVEEKGSKTEEVKTSTAKHKVKVIREGADPEQKSTE